MQLSPTFNRVRFVWLCVAALVLVALCLWIAGCGPTIRWPWESSGPIIGADGKPVTVGPRAEFANLLGQLQWLFIGLGVAAFVASIWVPLISTRHAIGSIVLGVGIALIKPFVVALYWPTIICLALAAVAAVWPYGLAVYTWAKARITGKPPDPSKLTTGLATLQTLWKPRSAVMADAAAADRAGNSDGVSPPDVGGGAG